jgi:hypothetical protein
VDVSLVQKLGMQYFRGSPLARYLQYHGARNASREIGSAEST